MLDDRLMAPAETLGQLLLLYNKKYRGLYGIESYFKLFGCHNIEKINGLEMNKNRYRLENDVDNKIKMYRFCCKNKKEKKSPSEKNLM